MARAASLCICPPLWRGDYRHTVRSRWQIDGGVSIETGFNDHGGTSAIRWPGFVLEDVGDEEFDQLLGRVYARDGSQARQMVEDIDDELDLARLAEALPETEDLLEREDDAPIIRLINALLTQAVRENASDVHIETFEKVLQVRFRVDGVLREVVQPRRALAPLLVRELR
ncbi:MAG: hypothetical protein CM1200mP9_03520 [Gammaproteobacteria bacterium]|nr:MAG: hypothetical protein CM1200mP9_03520 [Gammaproteobacteria bacterium]